MLFKRLLLGGPALKPKVDACREKHPPCERCDNSFIFEEIMRVIFLSLLLWGGITCGSVVMPYSLNFIINSDVPHPPPKYEYPFPSPQVIQRLPQIKEKHLNDSLQFGTMSVEALKRLEDNLRGSGVSVIRDNPVHGQLINGYPSHEALELQRISWTITKASSHLSYGHCGRYGIPDDECGSYISTFKLLNTNLGKDCQNFHNPSCSGKGTKKYRTYDGSCNNMKRKSWGKALSGFKRLIHPTYSDGIDQPRLSFAKNPLPSPRIISSSMAIDLNVPDLKHSLALMQWTQFIEHDLLHIPIRKMVHSDASINCCDRRGNSLAPRHQHPSCLSINVPRKDPFYGPEWINCLSYTRSVTTFRSDCTFGAAEQMNQASHFLDGSQIYGSNVKQASLLRENRSGLMTVSELDNGSVLPRVEPSNVKINCQTNDDSDICFKSGDLRVNMHPHLTSMHILWLREHNRIARKLAELNPTWNDEILYQESRRIVTAEIQHITYTQWLPVLLGKKFDVNDIGYSQDVNPSIANSFATSGLRFFTSMLSGNIQLYNEDRTVNETLELMDHFNRPGIVTRHGKFSQIVRGMISQNGQNMDLNMVDDITDQLYAPKNKKLGLDILSMDIQRGRDHGIPPYNQFRVSCGLKAAETFDDFTDVISDKAVDQLKKLYENPQDVDLLIGALAEEPKDGSVLGHTLSCLLEEQMSRTRRGDRYFYTNIEQPEPFTHQQLEQIEKANLARIICDNVPEISKLQKDAFSAISNINELVMCESSQIKRVNLVAWQDPNHKPDIITRTKRNVYKWMKES